MTRSYCSWAFPVVANSMAAIELVASSSWSTVAQQVVCQAPSQIRLLAPYGAERTQSSSSVRDFRSEHHHGEGQIRGRWLQSTIPVRVERTCWAVQYAPQKQSCCAQDPLAIHRLLEWLEQEAPLHHPLLLLNYVRFLTWVSVVASLQEWESVAEAWKGCSF